MVAAAGDWMANYDAVMTPPATGPAPEGLGATGDPACCTLWSLLGFPAITIPIGRAGAIRWWVGVSVRMGGSSPGAETDLRPLRQQNWPSPGR